MQFFSIAYLAVIANAAVATPIAIVAEETPSTFNGSSVYITVLDSDWHSPTSNDLEVVDAEGTFLSDEAGLPLSGSGNTMKRQSGVYRTNSARVGNGNPHQNPYHQQVSQTLPCGNGGCSVSVTKSHSISWTASANIAYGWISGGFSVSESYSSGTTNTCDGNPGGSVCIWQTYGVTAYTVAATQCYYFNGAASMCRNLGQRILYSPNNCQPAQPYCVRGSACRTENQGYYDKTNAPATGPPC